MSFNLKNAIPKLLKLNLVLTFDFANANSNASTHTNYLIILLKNDLKRGSNRSFSAGSISLAYEKLRFDPGFKQTHNYTGERGLINSPQAPAVFYLGVCRGTPCPQRAGHYSRQPLTVNYYLGHLSVCHLIAVPPPTSGPSHSSKLAVFPGE